MGKKSRLKRLKRFSPDQNQAPGAPAVINQEKIPKLAFGLIFVLVFIAGLLLRLHNLNNVTARSPDEQIYAMQAKTIADSGSEGVKSLLRDYGSNKDLWLFPPPTRIGYLGLLAQVMNVTKRTDANLGANISFAFSIASLALLVLLGLRFFNPWASLYALIFMSVSPLELAIARRTWLDAMLGCLTLALIYICCEITRNSRRIIWYILFILIGSYSLLTKETSLAIYGLLILWVLWVLCIKQKAYLAGVIFALASGLGAGISALVLIRAAGGIKPIMEVVQHMQAGLPANTYAFQYQTGPWYDFLLGFWITAPTSSLLFILGLTGAALHKEKLQRYVTLPAIGAIWGIIYFCITFMIFLIALPACQNLRYASPLFAVFYLLSGLGLWYLISFIKTKLNNFSLALVSAAVILGIMFAAISDYQSFQKIFVKTGIVDVSIRMLKEYSR